MKKNKIVFVDMDGVCADFDKAIVAIDPTLETRDGDDYEARSVRVRAICIAHDRFFENLEPIEGAIDAVKQLLLDDRYEVYFLSTPMWDAPESYSGKRNWLSKHFGDDLVRDRLILSRRKDLNVGDYLIDDTTRNGAGEFTGEHIHFATKEFPTWKEVVEYLDNKNRPPSKDSLKMRKIIDDTSNWASSISEDGKVIHVISSILHWQHRYPTNTIYVHPELYEVIKDHPDLLSFKIASNDLLHDNEVLMTQQSVLDSGEVDKETCLVIIIGVDLILNKE